MFTRVKHILVKEFLQALRDRRIAGIVFVAPVIQILVLGYAANLDVRDVRLAVFDADGTPSSRDLAARFDRSGSFRIVERAGSEAEFRDALDRGRAKAGLSVPAGFEADVLSGRGASVAIVVDGTDTLTSGVALAHGNAIVAEHSREALAARTARLAGAAPAAGGVAIEARAWFNESLESRNFFVPGVLGLLVTLVTLMLTCMAVVREKEIGTMEQILVTPIRPHEFILGKTLPFALIGFADIALVLAVGVLWFGVPVRGSVALLLAGMGLLVLTNLGVGLLISTVSRTQQQAMIGSFFFFMPAMLLSGFVFPIENMPLAVQAVTFADPLRYVFVIIRGIFLKGVGLGVLWPQFLGLALLGAAALSLAVLRFRKTME
jgi:ABC-2 type transport system permease protein